MAIPLFTETLVTMQDRSLPTDPNKGQGASAFDVLIRRVERAWDPARWKDANVVVAVSGGADSVALLRALAELKRRVGGRGDLVVATFDHGMRGTASSEDARWVLRLADKLRLRSHLGGVKTPSKGSEEDLRDARLCFYREAAEQLGARYVATGHTADDQAETVLFRILRGTGLRGLAGIRRHRELTPACTLVRPLLETTRAELIAALHELSQDYREDATNADPTFTRNWLRHEALPLLQSRFRSASSELAQLAEHAATNEALVSELAESLLAEASLEPDACGGVCLDSALLASKPTGLVVEAIRLAWRNAGWPEQAVTAEHWRRLAEIAQASHAATRVDFPAGVHARNKLGRFHLGPKAD